MEDIVAELERIYPKRIVSGLYKYPELNYRLRRLVNMENISSVKQYLSDIGFTYGTDSTILNLEEDIKRIFKEKFSDGKVSRAELSGAEYANIYKVAKEYGCEVSEYIKSLGYEYIKRSGRGQTSVIDYHCSIRLNKDFNVTCNEIGEYINLTRAAVNRVINAPETKSNVSWEIKQLDTESEEIYKQMILNHDFEFRDDENTYLIKNNLKGKICFIKYNESGIWCIFDENIPIEIKGLATENNMDRFGAIDYKVIEKSSTVYILKQKYIFIDDENKDLFNKGKRYHKKNKGKEYAEILGFVNTVTDKDKNTDERIINFLEEHLIDEKKVYIEASSKHQWLYTFISRCNMKIEEFIEFYGYEKAEKGYNVEEKYKKILKEYCIGESNKVLIFSTSRLYTNLYMISRNKNMSLDEYICSLGYERIRGNRSELAPLASSTKMKFELEVLENDINKILQYERDSIETRECIEEKRKRNRKLVDELKRIYGYRCQLCSDEEFMPILKDDKSFYVEVHHIKGLYKENEEENLDKLSNLIVVCANHHKLLHYHKGGYEKVCRENGKLFFYNKDEEKIEIKLNFHLGEIQ